MNEYYCESLLKFLETLDLFYNSKINLNYGDHIHIDDLIITPLKTKRLLLNDKSIDKMDGYSTVYSVFFDIFASSKSGEFSQEFSQKRYGIVLNLFSYFIPFKYPDIFPNQRTIPNRLEMLILSTLKYGTKTYPGQVDIIYDKTSPIHDKISSLFTIWDFNIKGPAIENDKF